MESSRLAALEAELARELAGLPEALQSSTPSLLVDYLATVFQEQDGESLPSTSYATEPRQPPQRWDLLAKMREEADNPESLKQIAAMEAAAARVTAEISEIERTCLPQTSDLGFLPKAGAGSQKGDLPLVSCKSCGQTVLAHAFMAHLAYCPVTLQQRMPSPAPSHSSLPGSSGRASSEQGRGGKSGQGKARRGRGMLGKSILANGSGVPTQAQRIRLKPAQREPPWPGAAWQGQYSLNGEAGAYDAVMGEDGTAWPPAIIPRRCRSQHTRKPRRSLQQLLDPVLTPGPALAHAPGPKCTFGSPSMLQRDAPLPATAPGSTPRHRHPPEQSQASQNPRFPTLPMHALNVLKPLTGLSREQPQAGMQMPGSNRGRGRLISRTSNAQQGRGASHPAAQQQPCQHQHFKQAAQPRRQSAFAGQDVMLPTNLGVHDTPLRQGAYKGHQDYMQQKEGPQLQPSWPSMAGPAENKSLDYGFAPGMYMDAAGSQNGSQEYGQAAQDDVLMYAPVQGDGPMDWSIGLLVENSLSKPPERPQVRSLPETGLYGPPAKKMGKLNSITQRLPTLPA